VPLWWADKHGSAAAPILIRRAVGSAGVAQLPAINMFNVSYVYFENLRVSEVRFCRCVCVFLLLGVCARPFVFLRALCRRAGGGGGGRCRCARTHIAPATPQHKKNKQTTSQKNTR
jgi:hypothetical protein